MLVLVIVPALVLLSCACCAGSDGGLLLPVKRCTTSRKVFVSVWMNVVVKGSLLQPVVMPNSDVSMPIYGLSWGSQTTASTYPPLIIYIYKYESCRIENRNEGLRFREIGRPKLINKVDRN